MLKKVITFVILIMMILTSTSIFAVDTYSGYDIPVDIEINGHFIQCVQKPVIISGTTYIPLRAFSDAIDGTITWDSGKGVATMTKEGHTFVFYPGKESCLVDGVEKTCGAIIYKDLTFIPVRAVSEVLNYAVEWDDFYLTVKISAPELVVPELCRDNSYTYEDVLYLGKIIQIECGHQPFQTKLGVAGTVVNRVKSSQFPNSVKEVILDTKYGVQFPPAHTDKINVTPSSECVIAAKCALNGVNVVGNSLYFIDVKRAPSSWVHNNRPHSVTIHDMSFYE
ncbi:MAG: cell wall hydrolase [Clostridia bacterium]|nr:cell wall hydrolase [Clostridia bacterium]